MALKTKIEFISQDRSGRHIVIKDKTGLESVTNPGGYGPTNGDVSEILSYYITVSQFSTNIEHTLKIDGSDRKLLTPEQIALGEELLFYTSLFDELQEDGNRKGACVFKDGVLDINMYVEFPGQSAVTITKDTNYILLDDSYDFEDVDTIVVNDVMYDVDHEKDDQAGTILYILGEFEEDASSFTICFRSNTKALLGMMSENLHAYASDKMMGDVENFKWDKIHTSLAFREAAKSFFTQDVPDYFKANKLQKAGYKLLEKFAL